MPTPVFTWFPDASVEVAHEPKVSIAKFGDGYEQRTALGLNTDLQKWSVTFTGLRAEIDPIDDFLRARGAVEAFTWNTPDEEELKFICRSWTKRRERGVKVTLTATFEQVPE